MRYFLIALSAMSVAAAWTPAMASPCRDSHGRFVKCPAAPAKPKQCKDAKGRFAKCGTPGAKPI